MCSHESNNLHSLQYVPVNTGYPVKHLFAQTWDEHKVLVICTSKCWAKPESSFTKGVNFLEKVDCCMKQKLKYTYQNTTWVWGAVDFWALPSPLAHPVPTPQKAHDKEATGEPYLTSHDLRIPSTCQITPHTEFFYGNIKTAPSAICYDLWKMSP